MPARAASQIASVGKQLPSPGDTQAARACGSHGASPGDALQDSSVRAQDDSAGCSGSVRQNQRGLRFAGIVSGPQGLMLGRWYTQALEMVRASSPSDEAAEAPPHAATPTSIRERNAERNIAG